MMRASHLLGLVSSSLQVLRTCSIGWSHGAVAESFLIARTDNVGKGCEGGGAWLVLD